MADEQDCIERIYTYTYDQFTVFFYDDHVFWWEGVPHTSVTPEELLAILKFEVYGEEVLSDPRWNSDFWHRSRH